MTALKRVINGLQRYVIPRSVIIITALICSLFSADYIAGQTADEEQLIILFIGDIMGHDAQISAAYDSTSRTYDYSDVFKYIKPVIEDADIAIANLEVTLAGPPYKGYPRFSSPAALASASAEAGIDIMVTANNHSADRGLSGINSTLEKLDGMDIAHTGVFRNNSEREVLVPHIIKKGDISLALLNYTYGTNGLPVPAPAIVNMTDREIMASDIDKARGKDVDGIIVYIHWGTEYDTLSGQNQRELADWLFERGVTMVIGSHPHVIQPMILERMGTKSIESDRLVVYSLGNFVSNQRKRRTDGGAMVRVTLSKDNNKLGITDAGYVLTWVYCPVINGGQRFHILPASVFEGHPQLLRRGDSYGKMMLFINDSRRLLKSYSRGLREIIPLNYPGNLLVDPAK